VESMTSSGKRMQVFDAEQRGLCLRISESGEKSFSVCYRHCGRMKRSLSASFRRSDWRTRAAGLATR
jgi:hypothetical protein